MSDIIGDEPCPSCRSRGRDSTGNHLMIFSNGNKYCNRCGYKEIKGEVTTEMPDLSVEDVKKLPSPNKYRGISKETYELFGVKQDVDESTGEPANHYYPYTRQGSLVSYKVRGLPKDFKRSVGSLKNVDFFGRKLCGHGRKFLFLTEGELDCLSAFEMFRLNGKTYACASLPNGAGGAKNDMVNNYKWLETFDKVYLCLDNDAEGDKAKVKVQGVLSPGKLFIVELPEGFKDPNEMLQDGKHTEFFKAVMNAQPYKPDCIVSSADTWNLIKNRDRSVNLPYPDGWDKMNNMAYGLRFGNVDTWTSGSGMGKTAVFRQLKYHVLKESNDLMADIALEEPLEDTVEGFMSLELKKRITLPDIRETVSEEELYEAWKNTNGTGRILYYDHFLSTDNQELLDHCYYLAKLGVKYFFLDHLSVMVSEYADQGNERERIDSLMTKLKRFATTENVWLGLIVHLRKSANSGGRSFEEGATPSLDDLRGSGSIKQLSDNVFALSRNQQNTDEYLRNITQLHVLKCRLTGRTGQADYLHFDDQSGWMIPVEDPYNQEPDDSEFDEEDTAELEFGNLDGYLKNG